MSWVAVRINRENLYKSLSIELGTVYIHTHTHTVRERERELLFGKIFCGRFITSINSR